MSKRRPLTPSTRRVRAHRHLPRTYVELDQPVQEVLKKPNVVGCYVGYKVTERKRTDVLSLVCLVSSKVRRRDLAPDTELIPGHVEWRDARGTRRRVRTDVRHWSRGFTLTNAVAGPGDEAQTEDAAATVGFALIHPTLGPVVTTAGHLVASTPGSVEIPPGQSVAIRLANVSGDSSSGEARAVKVVLTKDADYALLSPTDIPCGNRYRDLTPVAAPFVPTASDVGRKLVLLAARGAQPATLVGISGVSLEHPIVGEMRGLLVAKTDSIDGDSGACLVDVRPGGEMRVWGLLVGNGVVDGTPCALFMSALVPLALEGALYLV
jgi:hypothetical protein